MLFLVQVLLLLSGLIAHLASAGFPPEANDLLTKGIAALGGYDALAALKGVSLHA